MKYAINFHRSFRYMNEVDEIILHYDDKNYNIIEFLKDKKQEQRIVLDVTEIEDIKDYIKIFSIAQKEHQNFAIKLSMKQEWVVADLYEENISFFFEEFVDTWDKLVSLVKLNVSDVYIVSDLGFDLQDVSTFCKKHKVNIRVFPNIAQVSSKINNLDKIKSFFIRPEDMSIYEQYVDICEFFGDLDRQSVLYEIYTKQSWLGNLNDLILNLKMSLYSKTVVPMFAEARVNCKKRCIKGKKCSLCDRVLETAKLLEENNIIIKEKKE